MTVFRKTKSLVAGIIAVTVIGLGSAHAAEKFNLSPDTSNRVRAEKDDSAIKAIASSFKIRQSRQVHRGDQSLGSAGRDLCHRRQRR